MSREEAEQRRLLRGVAVLMPATVLTKVVGLCYKIPLIAIVGVSGMAYFLAAYHIYSVAFVLVATGLPTALSLAVARYTAADEGRAARRALWVALTLLLTVGLCGSIALLLFAPQLAARIAMADAAVSIVAIAPALLLASFTGAVKGYFQGLQQMLPTAVSEVLEALGKLGFGLWLALLARGRGLPAPMVAAYAIFGITLGQTLAALVLAVILAVHLLRTGAQRRQSLPRRRAVLGELLRHALPLTANSLVMSVATLIDTVLISSRLQAAGFAPAAADTLYSAYGNLAMPLYNLLPALLAPVTVALMPLLGAATAKGSFEAGREAVGTALRLTLLLSIPAALGLAAFSEPLLVLIFGAQDCIGVASPLLSLLSLSLVPVALVLLFGAALQALGHTLLPVAAMGLGALVKLTVEAVLLSLPAVHIYGAPVSTLCCNLTVLTVEAVALSRRMPPALSAARSLFLPLAAAVAAVGAGGAAYFLLLRQGCGQATALLPALPLTVAVYFLLALRIGVLTRAELAMLPLGDRLCQLLEKCRMLK